MKVKELVAVIERASRLSAGERASLLKRLARILSKLPPNDTVARSLKKRG